MPSAKRLDRITEFNRTHRRIAKLHAQGLPFEELQARSNLRADKLRYLLENPLFPKLFDGVKSSGTEPTNTSCGVTGNDDGGLTLAQLASKERRASIASLASIRDSSESDTARVQAASAIINQTKDFVMDEDALNLVATQENVDRMVRASQDIKWYAEKTQAAEEETPTLKTPTQEEPEDAESSEPSGTRSEVEDRPQADPRSVRRVPLCV